MRVYDGVDSLATMIGEFTGLTLPAAVTATSGAMFVQFSSDYSTTAAGWEASYITGSTTIPVTSVTVTPATASINVSATVQLTATVAPANATDTSVVWSSGDNAIATVDANGLVTGVTAGIDTIYVTTTDGNFTDYAVITVTSTTIPVTSVTVTPPTASINVSATVQLTATIAPANATDTSVVWSSGDNAIATVDTNGLVTGVTAGIDTIYVTTTDGNFTDYAVITVTSTTIPVTSVTVTPATASINVSATVQLTATIAPANATVTSVVWSSSDNAIATVDANGLVTGVTAGIDTIYATTNDGSFVDYAIITINSLSYCSGTTNLVAFAGNFSDGSGVNNYTDNSDCKWLIQPTGATSIQLTFSAFDTELDYDFVTIYDGSDTLAAILGSFSGSTIPTLVNSTGGTMLVRFQSDYINVATGWDASYSATTGLADLKGVENIAIIPNPNNGEFDISFALMNNSDVKVEIINTLGETIWTDQKNLIAGQHQNSLNLSSQASGIYMLKINTNGKVYQRRIVIE